LFTNVVEAAPRVGERAFGEQVRVTLERLDPGLRVGSWGQLQEWKDDLDDRKNDHRHVSYLFALHPGTADQYRGVAAVRDVRAVERTICRDRR
jgi:alpha-L-fucosidase 2